MSLCCATTASDFRSSKNFGAGNMTVESSRRPGYRSPFHTPTVAVGFGQSSVKESSTMSLEGQQNLTRKPPWHIPKFGCKSRRNIIRLGRKRV
eukprot:1282333-Amphidinium_carterae.2